MKIAATVGLPLSGRTTAANVAKEYGIPVLTSLNIGEQERAVIDGIDMSRFKELKKGVHKVYTITLLTPAKMRYERSDKKSSFERFLERDETLLDQGLDKLIALADYNIVNEGNLEDLKFEAKRVFSKIFNIEQVFLWAWKKEKEKNKEKDKEKEKEKEKGKTIDLVSELFPESRIYEGETKILASTRSTDRLKEIIKEIKNPLLQYFEIKEKTTHVLGENVLKFGLDREKALQGKTKLATSFERNLELKLPVPDVLMIELITEDPRRFVRKC